MNLVAGLIHYNDLESMKRTIDSIYDHVDCIIAVDGKFSLREGEDYSSDGSTEYLQSLEKIIIKKFTGYEHDKRNIYMEEATRLKADAVLIIDSDEYIQGNWGKFYKSLEKNINNPHPYLGLKYIYNAKTTTFYPRICLRPQEVRYWKAHNIFECDGNRQRIKSTNSLGGIFLYGDDTLRDPEWLKKTQNYQTKMFAHEKPIKQQVLNQSLHRL